MLEYKGLKKEIDRKIVIYTRMSTNNQRDDLINQVRFLRNFEDARGLIVDEFDSIVITHKDRFIRFGYEWFERFLGKFNTKIIVVNNEDLSPQEELVQDIISILHVFSGRIYGMRKYKKKIREDEDIAKSIQNRNPSHTGTEKEN